VLEKAPEGKWDGTPLRDGGSEALPWEGNNVVTPLLLDTLPYLCYPMGHGVVRVARVVTDERGNSVLRASVLRRIVGQGAAESS